MKRILSVILSLALLASALIIPMSVSAEATDASIAAAQAVIDAVNDLETNLNNVSLVEIAEPVDSPTSVDDSTWNSAGSTDCIELTPSTVPVSGSKTVKVTKDNPVTKTSYGIQQGDLIAIRYKTKVPVKLSMTKNIDYLVLYVKTNRSFTMRIGTHNGSTYVGAIKDSIQVEAMDGYQPIVIDFQNDIANTIPSLYSSNDTFRKGLYVSIAAMTDDGENTIEGSDITFSSAVYVPADEAVRDFKYDLSTVEEVTPRFTADAGVTADMILAAEKIENDGRYDAAKFSALQTAISAAKKVFIDNATEAEIIALFKSEAEELYKLEEIFVPVSFETANGSIASSSSINDIAGLDLTDDQKASFGDYAVKVTENFKTVNFADRQFLGNNDYAPNVGVYTKNYTDYKNVYLAVYNAGTRQSTKLGSYDRYSNGVLIHNNCSINNNYKGTFDLYSGYHLYNLYATPVNDHPSYYALQYVVDKSITVFNCYRMFFTSLDDFGTTADTSEGTEIYFGSVFGEKPISLSTFDESVNDKKTLIKYYIDNIEGKGYANTAAVEDTVGLLGVTTVEVVRELDNTIKILYPPNPDNTVDYAVVGQDLKFKLDENTIDANVTVTVKYGDEVLSLGEDGYYTIKVEKGKVLYIIPSHNTVGFAASDASNYFKFESSVSKNITPTVKTQNNKATPPTYNKISNSNIAKYSNGDLASAGDVGTGIVFRNKADSDDQSDRNYSGTFYNGFNPNSTTPDDFNFDQDPFDAYVDIIYDLGSVYDVNKVQHFAAGTPSATANNLSMGAYAIYAALSEEDLFNSESRVLTYQNKNYSTENCQSHDISDVPARYVAFRVYYPSTYLSNLTDMAYFDRLRIAELAIYGDPVELTQVNVIRDLDNTIDFTYPASEKFTLDNAAVGRNLKFKLDETTVAAGATVTIKYGDEVLEPGEDGFYTITVEEGKALTITPSYQSTGFLYTDKDSYFTTENNISTGLVPIVYASNYTKDPQTREIVSDPEYKVLSTGRFQGGELDFIANGLFFRKTTEANVYSGDTLNGYDLSTTPADFDFNPENGFDAYVDVVYDLGRVYDVNKVQHFSASGTKQNLSLGAYAVYAAESAEHLFDSESRVLVYQNKNYATENCQSHTLSNAVTARYVAFRVYFPITYTNQTSSAYYDRLRIKELAIYGTPTADDTYRVTDIVEPTSETAVDAGDLLTADTYESIVAYENGVLKGTFPVTDTTNLNKLNSQTYGAAHADLGVWNNGNRIIFYDTDGNCKNGYSFDRSNLNGNIVFNIPNTDPVVYYDITYDLKEYYYIDRFDAFLSKSGTVRRVQAYEVYISTDRDTLYTPESKVATYYNYYNTAGQKIEFDQAKVGRYIGFRALNPGTANDAYTYLRIDELSAYGTKITSAEDAQLQPKGGLSSERVYILNTKGSSVYTENDVKYTATRLSVKYQSPKDTETGLVDTSKILLANGDSANIVERNVIAIAKSKYSKVTGLDITTAGAFNSTATGENLKKCWEIKDQDVYAVFKLNKINSTQKDYEFVVTGRIVYEYNGTYYTQYSPVFGADQDISAQSVFTEAFGSESNQGWFK